MRRAVSSAYYALFHALCYVCADQLVGWSKGRVLEPLYRSLDHSTARTRLKSPAAKAIAPQLERIGIEFAILQEQRYFADYGPPAALLSRGFALTLIGQAREAIALLESLDAEARLNLAVLLIARQRAV
jgi:hypothetical protein